MAGNNPEARAITEVIGSQAKQTTKASPMRIGYCQGRGEVGLPRLIESLSFDCKSCHESPSRSDAGTYSAGYRPPETGPNCRIKLITAGPIVTKMIDGRTKITSGGTILIVVFAACSSARCRRSVRRESECTRRAWATLVPKRSV